MASRRRTEEERLRHQAETGDLGPYKTRDYLPSCITRQFNPRPDTAAALASGTMTAACGLWCLGSIIGFINSAQSHPLPPGQTWNIQLVFDTVPLNRWAVSFVVSLLSTAFLFAQTLCLLFYVCMESRSRRVKIAEDLGIIIPTQDLEITQLEMRKQNAKDELERKGPEFEERRKKLQTNIYEEDKQPPKEGSNIITATKRKLCGWIKHELLSTPALKLGSRGRSLALKPETCESSTRSGHQCGSSATLEVEIPNFEKKSTSRSVVNGDPVREPPVKTAVEETRPDESSRQLPTMILQTPQPLAESINAERNENQPVHPLEQETVKAGGSGEVKNQREIPETKEQENTPIRKITEEKLRKPLPPIPEITAELLNKPLPSTPETTEDDNGSKPNAVEHKLAPSSEEVATNTSLPTQMIPRKPLNRSSQLPPPAPPAVANPERINRKPLPARPCGIKSPRLSAKLPRPQSLVSALSHNASTVTMETYYSAKSVATKDNSEGSNDDNDDDEAKNHNTHDSSSSVELHSPPSRRSSKGKRRAVPSISSAPELFATVSGRLRASSSSPTWRSSRLNGRWSASIADPSVLLRRGSF